MSLYNVSLSRPRPFEKAVTPSQVQQQKVQPTASEERKPSPSLAYALQCEKYAQMNFTKRLNDAYEYADNNPDVPAEVTTPARRGSYGPTCY